MLTCGNFFDEEITKTSSSLSARSEHLEYPCANFVQTPIDSKRSSSVLNCCNDCDNDLEKMTIKCHYNPIMDEYLRFVEILETRF